MRGHPLAWALLDLQCWGFQRLGLKQGAAGTGHFEPGGVFFRDVLLNSWRLLEQKRSETV
jgi:hypothetical protein